MCTIFAQGKELQFWNPPSPVNTNPAGVKASWTDPLLHSVTLTSLFVSWPLASVTCGSSVDLDPTRELGYQCMKCWSIRAGWGKADQGLGLWSPHTLSRLRTWLQFSASGLLSAWEGVALETCGLCKVVALKDLCRGKKVDWTVGEDLWKKCRSLKKPCIIPENNFFFFSHVAWKIFFKHLAA